MSQQAYDEASANDRQHFFKCRVCNGWLDMRSLDEVFSHETDHQEHPDIQYGGSQRVS